MDLDLAGRRALVTGGSRGIGRGIVEALAGEGAHVLFCGRDQRSGEALAAELKAAGKDAAFVLADVESNDGIDALAREALARGAVDILVNNVGGAHDAGAGSRPFTEIPAGDWPLTFMKCVFNAVRLTNHLAPPMQARGWGRIVNISSTAGLEPGKSPADYAAAKAALSTATVALSTSLAKSGVTANVIAPGPILTKALADYIEFIGDQRGWPEQGDDRHGRFIAEVMPLKTKRIGRPEDIGAAVAFLASPLADYVTGAKLRVDGGMSAAAI
jgi:NAD(P)-dependent dehydrogenase (short-subunit alcohol dehydrogenase family)